MWKEDYEKNNNTWFVKDSGKKSATIYYYCNRSGNFKSRSSGKRHLKSQGTSKIDTYCTAGLIVNINTDGTMDAKIHKSHYGHNASLGHLRIPESDRKAIASKLASGIEIQYVLDEIRDKIGDSYQRIHLLTRKDITNIKMAFCVQGNKRHHDDATSVHLWVEEMKAQQNNPVLFYKPQGQELSESIEQLSKNDFVLAIQTSLQADVLKRFSSDKVVCVDSTHGTNGYDFTLITLMIIDEYGEGFPVAWCISNGEDQPLLLQFYGAIKNRVGPLSPSGLCRIWQNNSILHGYQHFLKAAHPTDFCALGMWTELGGNILSN